MSGWGKVPGVDVGNHGGITVAPPQAHQAGEVLRHGEALCPGFASQSSVEVLVEDRLGMLYAWHGFHSPGGALQTKKGGVNPRLQGPRLLLSGGAAGVRTPVGPHVVQEKDIAMGIAMSKPSATVLIATP